jgi:hypothetical protein
MHYTGPEPTNTIIRDRHHKLCELADAAIATPQPVNDALTQGKKATP